MGRRFRGVRAAAVAVAVAALLAGCGIASAPERIRRPEPVLPPPPLEMTAFQPAYADPSRIDASAGGIDVVSVASIALVDGGAGITPTTDPRVLRHRERAKSLGKVATLLVANSAPGIGFSGDLASGTLRSPENRGRVADALAQRVRDEHWDGLMLDFESLDRDDAAGYVRFVSTLRKKVGDGIRLDAAIMTATSRSGYLARGYDVPGLAKQLDGITLMAYDQHGTWSPSNPGPVGSLDWQRACLEALVKLAPADKVDLGVAGYGYRWAPDGVHAVADSQARRLVSEDASARVRWDETAREWNATLSDGSVMWWSDATSLRSRVSLARELRIRGIAVWSLAVSDPIERPRD